MSNGITVLVIDDEKDLVDAVGYQLKAKNGYNVETAYNGLEGLQKLKNFKPHLIILDLNMPKMGGIEFYKNICKKDGTTEYPVLILTARANLEYLFKELNVDGFMTKPFDLDSLIKTAETIIQKRFNIASVSAAAIVKKVKKLLIVEDDDAVFGRIAITFLNAGYEVLAAKSGVAAIDKIMSEAPDVSIIKLGLKDIPGELIAAKFKAMPMTKDIPLVLYTAQNDMLNYAVTKKLCENAGINSIVDTDDPNRLLKEVEDIFEKS